MEVNRKKAPQKKVLEITRTGKWGSVVYLHSLECGHLEERKRPAKTKVIACGRCVMADDFGKRTVDLVRTGVGYESITEMNMTPDPIELIFSSSEKNIARIKDGVSAFLGVEPDDVNVFVEDDENMLVTGGSIFLSATDLMRIARIGNPSFSATEEN